MGDVALLLRSVRYVSGLLLAYLINHCFAFLPSALWVADVNLPTVAAHTFSRVFARELEQASVWIVLICKANCYIRWYIFKLAAGVRIFQVMEH